LNEFFVSVCMFCQFCLFRLFSLFCLLYLFCCSCLFFLLCMVFLHCFICFSVLSFVFLFICFVRSVSRVCFICFFCFDRNVRFVCFVFCSAGPRISCYIKDWFGINLVFTRINFPNRFFVTSSTLWHVQSNSFKRSLTGLVCLFGKNSLFECATSSQGFFIVHFRLHWGYESIFIPFISSYLLMCFDDQFRCFCFFF
jgi:hypothetical protein